jgi:hypothetical protein
LNLFNGVESSTLHPKLQLPSVLAYFVLKHSILHSVLAYFVLTHSVLAYSLRPSVFSLPFTPFSAFHLLQLQLWSITINCILFRQ